MGNTEYTPDASDKVAETRRVYRAAMVSAGIPVYEYNLTMFDKMIQGVIADAKAERDEEVRLLKIDVVRGIESWRDLDLAKGETVVWRERAERAEAKLAAVAELADSIERDSHCSYLARDIRAVLTLAASGQEVDQ